MLSGGDAPQAGTPWCERQLPAPPLFSSFSTGHPPLCIALFILLLLLLPATHALPLLLPPLGSPPSELPPWSEQHAVLVLVPRHVLNRTTTEAPAGDGCLEGGCGIWA
jgi:hypothetical protein